MDTAALYVAFADEQARGYAPLYEDWARSIAVDAEALAAIDALPPAKRQPNLVFAAARTAGVPLSPWGEARSRFVERGDEIRAIALARATQTNEAARTGVLLPRLARIEGPIALVEVGASAGLCLLPDRYSYRYRAPGGTHELHPADGPSTVVIECEVDDDRDVPARLPEVAWRAGLDLNPLRADDPDDAAWLETLLWPGEAQEPRRRRLEQALAIAAADPPRIVAGDLRRDLAALVAEAPRDATLVVIHTAVLLYLPAAERQAAVTGIRATGALHLANEGLAVLPGLRDRMPPDTIPPAWSPSPFVLSEDGVPVAFTAPHGGRYSRIRSDRG